MTTIFSDFKPGKNPLLIYGYTLPRNIFTLTLCINSRKNFFQSIHAFVTLNRYFNLHDVQNT